MIILYIYIYIHNYMSELCLCRWLWHQGSGSVSDYSYTNTGPGPRPWVRTRWVGENVMIYYIITVITRHHRHRVSQYMAVLVLSSVQGQARGRAYA